MDAATVTQITGLIVVLIVQFGQTIRAWWSSKKNTTNTKQISAELITIKKELAAIKKINEKEHLLLFDTTKKIDDQLEHNSFIPAFEIEMENYNNTIVSGFTFEDKKIKSMSLSIASGAKEVFINILKVGFTKFSLTTLMNNFDMQEMKVTGILESHSLEINKKRLFNIITIEREAFIIKITEIIKHKSNGDRQDAFEILCQNYIFKIIKEISSI